MATVLRIGRNCVSLLQCSQKKWPEGKLLIITSMLLFAAEPLELSDVAARTESFPQAALLATLFRDKHSVSGDYPSNISLGNTYRPISFQYNKNKWNIVSVQYCTYWDEGRMRLHDRRARFTAPARRVRKGKIGRPHRRTARSPSNSRKPEGMQSVTALKETFANLAL